MHSNLLAYVEVRGALNTTAAGTGDTVAGTVIDRMDYSSIAFITQVGTIASGGTVKVKIQHGDLANGSDMADIAGSGVDLADTDDNKRVCHEIYHGTKRYYRVAIVRGTANSDVPGSHALLYEPRSMAVPASSTTVKGIKILNGPISGTA